MTGDGGLHQTPAHQSPAPCEPAPPSEKHLQSFRGKAFSLLSELQQIYDRAFQISASPWQPVLGLEVEMNDSSLD